MSIQDDIFLQAMNEDKSVEVNLRGLFSGTVISKGDAEYFLSGSGKTEVILPESETVNDLSPGDTVMVAFTGDKDGVPYVSMKKAMQMQAMENIRQALKDNSLLQAIVEVLVSKDSQLVGYEVSIGGVRAFLPISHVRSVQNPQDLIGKEFAVLVLDIKRDRQGSRIVVSERKARYISQRESFDSFSSGYNPGDKISAKVQSVEEAFALLTAEGVNMFMHVTEFDWKYVRNLQDVLKPGDILEVAVQSIDPQKRSVKVSRKAVVPDPFDVFVAEHRIGDNVPAKTVRFARNLVIVEDDKGVEMLLPVSEMSWTSRVSDPKRLLNLGDRIEVKIKEIQLDTRKIVVSLRDLLENPWHSAAQKYAVGTKHEGIVTSITDFGIFVAFDDGIQGLIRKENIDWINTDLDLTERFKKGDPVTATVLHIDSSKERLQLGIKQLSANPYQNFADNHPNGAIVSGTVLGVSQDGVTVKVEGGLEAFIHVSQLSREHVNDPRSLYKEGNTLKAAVRRVNVDQNRIELSVKEAEKVQEQQDIAKHMNPQTVNPTLGDILGAALDSVKKSGK
ncbi:small subunit ribosomal protein S1 [Brevinema andersonii]|uniref:Small subunit ribosomal protein S1 n=1 Tax=Brevinema andersonii TaxID=34097 RepID=A0A1I1DCI9_BREAD|nr:S1 RNA-binding domain-containing protein [Brevinema andersonii]SFB72076.1 small subunit ribosomal protein S1 [Brevinema andersonii]